MDMFPLPTLGPELLKIADIVYNSLGFSIIRGLDLGEFDPNDRVIVFLGLSSYVGEERGPQDRHGTMISESAELVYVFRLLTSCRTYHG